MPSRAFRRRNRRQDAVHGAFFASRELAILYQQLGGLYRDTNNYQAAIYTFQELGHLGEEEDRRARMLIMEPTAGEGFAQGAARPEKKRWQISE